MENLNVILRDDHETRTRLLNEVDTRCCFVAGSFCWEDAESESVAKLCLS